MDPDETYDSGLLQSHPDVAGHSGPSFHSNEDSEERHSQSKVPNIMQACIDIADQFLPDMVEATLALA